VSLDLLWQRGQRLEADEVKSSVLQPGAFMPAAQEQALEQARAAREHFGPGFAGVRIAALAMPPASVWVPV
jgi:hypothetical protein